MAAYQAEEIADVVTAVRKRYRPNTYTILTTDLQEYVAMSRLLKKKRREKGGQKLLFSCMVAENDRAHPTALFASDDPTQADLFKTGEIPWRHITTDYSFDEREPELNTDPEDLVQIVKGRRTDAFIGMAKLFEQHFWGTPTGSEASEDAPPYGVKYWIQRTATTVAGAFQGGNPSGFSSGCAGLSSSTYANWKNWSAGYSTVDEDTFVKRLRMAATKTRFINPVRVPEPTTGATRYGYYTNYDCYDALYEVGKTRNDNLGFDLAGQTPMFRKTAIEWAPYLDDDSEDPFYGIDWSVFEPVFLRGEWMKELQQRSPNQHRVITVFIDCTLNYQCTNRRKLFVLYKN